MASWQMTQTKYQYLNGMAFAEWLVGNVTCAQRGGVMTLMGITQRRRSTTRQGLRNLQNLVEKQALASYTRGLLGWVAWKVPSSKKVGS